MIAVIAAPLIWLWYLVLGSSGVVFPKTSETIFPRIEFFQELRRSFLGNISGLTSQSEALVAGLAIGERDALSEEFAEQMRQLGLTHLVAVSGANLAIVAAAVYFLAAAMALGRNLRFVFATVFILCYVLIVGPEPSVLRAWAMTMAVMISIWLGRGTSPVVALSWAVLVILLVDSSMSQNFGFALSVAATLGLLVLAKPLYEKLKPKLPAWLALGMASTVSAQLYTWPIVLLIQPGIASYSIVSNLLSEPVVAPVTILGVTAAISSWSLPWLTSVLSWLASIGTFWIELVTRTLSSLPAVRLPWLPSWLGILFATLIAVFVTMLLYQKRTSLVGLALVSTLSVAAAYVATDLVRQGSWLEKDWEVVMCDVGQGDALVLREDSKVALIDTGSDPSLVDSCLSELGIRKIDLVVLTHFDRDHAGGLAGALKNRAIGLVLISGFADDRPLVEEVKQLLTTKSISPLVAQTGMHGLLGSASWQVLSPSLSAKEAKDANDASVVIAFRFEQFSVLALGDLGEAGQDRLLKFYANALSELRSVPLALKVSHHGSADQSALLHKFVQAELALVSVGKGNDYGHPRPKTLDLLATSGATIVRTDLSGTVGVKKVGAKFEIFAKGKLSQ